MTEGPRNDPAFHVEAVRAGLFNAALDMAATMKEGGVIDGEAALITGSVEFACQLFMQVALAAGVTRVEATRNLLKQTRQFARKHGRHSDEV